jgi:hypothetical protein
MPEDRMRNDDLDRKMAGGGQKDQDKYSQKTPGRSQQDDNMSTGQRGAGKHGDQGHMKDDSEKSGAGQGGQNRQNR